MAKSKIISASIAVDIQNLQEVTGAVQGLSKDLSNIPIDKNLETRLKNVEKTVTNVVKQISTMTDKIDVLSKAGGLDPKTLNDLSLLTTAISDVRIEVDALATKVNNFSKGISDVGDIGIKKVSENISKEIGNMANNIDTSISNATVSIQKGGEKLKKTYEQLLQSVNAEVDVEGIDATKIFKFSDVDDVDAEFKKVKTKLQKDLKDLADATTNYNNLKIGGGSADDVAKAAKAQVNALNKLKESFEAFYGMEDLEDRVGENMTKGMTANINEVIKAFPNLQGEVYRTFDEMYDFIDAVMENISNDFTSSINTLKESLKSISSEVETPAKKSAAETKNKVKSVEKAAASGITTDVVIKEGVGAELIAELKTVIDNLQKYVDKNPVELNAVINPTWGTKQTQKYLKSIREQLSKTKNGKIDENLAARIYGLQDAFGKDFSEALNKSISKLKDSLQKEGFSVGKLKIEDTAIKDFREQISNEIGAITVDINANILGTTIVDKDKQDVVNKQFEELKALGRLDPDKINNLVKTIKDTGADLDYSDIYKDRLKQIIKSLVDGVYGSVPEAIKKTRYPAGANPLIGEFNDNSARIKSITERIKEGAKGDALHYFNNQLKSLVERQKTILAELQQNVEDVKDTTVEGIKDAIQKIDVANIEVGTATININNADATFSNITTSTPADQTPNAEATLTANRDELIALANQRFKELANSENIDFKAIESLVSDLRKIGVESINPKLTNNTVGRTVEAMLKGGYTSALEAFQSTTSHSEEAKAKALEAQQVSKFFERFQKLYAMQTMQEKGTGSEKSIQMFVDAVRKSGVDFKVNSKYQDNEIGQLVNSMLTSGYKTVAEAIAVRDNKTIEQPQKKNIEKATINVNNLTIKGQQNIEKVTQKVTSANIEVKKGSATIAGATTAVKNPDENKSVPAPDTTKVEAKVDKKLQSLIDKYNQNINNADNMSLKEFLKKQEKLLSDMNLVIQSKQNNNQSTEKAEVSAAESLKSIDSKILHDSGYGDRGIYDSLTADYHRGLISEETYYKQLYKHGFISEEELTSVISKSLEDNQTRIDKAIDKLDSILTGTTMEDRYELFRSGMIYQTDFPHELSYLLNKYTDDKVYATGSARTLLEPNHTTQATVGAYTVEAIHNHPSNDLTPSYADVYSWFQDLDTKIDEIQYQAYSAYSNGDDFIDHDAYHQFYGSIVDELGEYFKFDMSHMIDLDESERNQIRDKILKGLIASTFYSTSTNSFDHPNEFINLLLGKDGSFRTYAINDEDGKYELLESAAYDLDPTEIESFFKLFDFVDKNFDLNALLASREGGYGADYNYTMSFYKKHENEINKLAGDDSLDIIEDIVRERDLLIEEFISQYNKISEMLRNGEGGEAEAEALQNLFDDMTDNYELISKWDTFSDEKKFNYPQGLFNYLKSNIFFARSFKPSENPFENTPNDIILNEIDNISSTVDKTSSSSTLNRDLMPLIQGYLDNIDNIISSTTDEALKTNLASLKDNIQNNFSILSSQLANDNVNEHKEAIQDIRQNINSFNEITSALDIKSKQIGVFLKNIKKIRDNINDNEGLKLSASAQKTITDSKEELDQLKLQLETAQKNNDYSAINEEEITQRILELKNATEDAIQKTVVNKIDVQGLIRKLDNLQIDEVKADPEVVSQVKTLRKRLQDIVDDDAEEMLTKQYKEYAKQVSQLSGTVSKSDRTIFGNFMKELRHKNYQALAQFFSLNDILRYMREAINVIKQYDTALIEMMKVSDETRESLERYQETLFDTADAIGSAALTLEKSTADWMRIGESLTEAAKSAQAAQILMNVSEFQSIDEATQALVSASQAYAALDKMDIVDKINKLGNEFPIATDQLATALQNSAAALTTQGNDLNEALALVVGGNVITQDALKTGTGIRTIALRIAGTKEAKDELAELGEGVDDFVVRTESKTRQLIMDYTAVASNGFKGVDIYDANGNLRSTYQILQDIADIYKEIQLEDRQAGTNRANALVELLAGKNRSNIAASILTNPDTIREAYEAAQNAEGSAMTENEKYLTSVEAHITKFKNAVDELINDLVDSGFVNQIIDLGTKAVSAIDKLVKHIGGLGSTLLAIGLIVGGKKGFFSSFIANMPVLIEGFKQFSSSGLKLNEIMQLLGITFKSTKGEAVAFSTALSTTGVGLLIAGISLAITYFVKVVDNIKKARQAVRDYAKETKDTNASLDEYAKRIGDARDVLSNEYSTTEEIINAKNELNEIQNELNETYGNYNDILKDTNATIEQQNALLIQNALNKNKEVVNQAKENNGNIWALGGLITAAAGSEYDNALDFLNKDIQFRSDDFSDKSDIVEYAKLRDNLLGDIFTRDQTGRLFINNDLDRRDVLQRIQEAERVLGNMDSIVSQELLEDLKEYEDSLSDGIEDYSDIMDAIGQDMASIEYADDYNNAMEKYFEYLEKGTDESRQELVYAVEQLWKAAAEENNNASKYWIKSFFGEFTDAVDNEAFNTSWKELNRGTTHALGRDRNSMSVLSIYSDWLTKQGVASDEILRYLQGSGNVSLSDEQKEYIDAIRGILNQFNIGYKEGIAKLVSDGLLYDTNTMDFNKQLETERQEAIESGIMTGEEFDALGINDINELDTYILKVKNAATNATEAMEMFTMATSGLAAATGASDVLKDMESHYRPVFNAMAEAYQAIWTTEGYDITKVTSAQLEGIRSQFESINSSLKEVGVEGIDDSDIDEFILKMVDAETTEEEAQEAFNKLATTLVDSLNPAIAQASGATAELMQKTLTEMGVVNAEEVVMSRLGFTAEQYAKAKEEAANNDLDIDQEIGKLTDEQLLLIANNEALLEYYSNRILANSLNIETAEDIEGLLKLCKTLKIATIGTYSLIDAEKKFNEIQNLKKIADTAGSNAVRESYLQKYNDAIAEFKAQAEVDWNPDINVNFNPNETSSTSSGSTPSPQDFDWIERAIKKIQRAVTNFGKIADATYKVWGTRLDGITNKYGKLQDEIILQQQAAQAYMQEANAVGLNEEYASKVRDGLMDIETITDETLKDQISKYQEYYDKATDAADAVEDLRGEIAQLAQAKFDNITKQFEEMALAIDHAATRIGHIQSKMSSEGYFESSTLIEQILFGDKEKLSQLEDEARQLAASIDEAVAKGDIEYGSEQWWGMYDSLQNVNDQIVEMKSNMADLNDQLRQMEWDRFDYIQDSIERLRTENDFLVDTLETENQLFEKVQLMNTDIMVSNGNWTEAATAIQGLRVNNLQILQKQNEEVADEIKKINKDLANDPNNKKLLERRNDLIDQQQDIIKGITQEKQSIKSLIQEGYETFLDYLQKSIDKRKEALNAEKSLYDYERNVADQTKAIADYRKQLAALGGDDSEENRARMQQLRDDLTKAEKDLQDTEYERWLSDQEEMMDSMYESFENLINERLDDLDGLIERAIQQTADNTGTIAQTIQEQADEFIYDLDNTSFGVNFDARISDAVTAVNSVENAINNMINAANINAQNELAQLQALAQTIVTQAQVQAQQAAQVNVNTGNSGSNSTSGGTSTSSGGTNTSKGTKADKSGVTLNKGINTYQQNEAKIAELNKKIEMYYAAYDNAMKEYNKLTPNSYNYSARINALQTAGYYQQLIDQAQDELRELNKAKFAKGGTIGSAIKGTGEDGIILARTGEEVLSLERIKQMQGIFKMMQPLAALGTNKTISNIGGTTTVNGMNVSFELPNVTSYEDFVRQAKNDPSFEKLVQNMTIGTALGKSKLSKYS